MDRRVEGGRLDHPLTRNPHRGGHMHEDGVDAQEAPGVSDQRHGLTQPRGRRLEELGAGAAERGVQRLLLAGPEQDHGHSRVPGAPLAKERHIAIHRPASQGEVLGAARSGMNPEPGPPRQTSVLQPVGGPPTFRIGEEHLVSRPRQSGCQAKQPEQAGVVLHHVHRVVLGDRASHQPAVRP